MEGRGIYRERNGWGTQHSVRVNTTSIKNTTFQKIAIAPAATSRHSINSRGKTRAPTTMPRGGF